MYKKMSRKPVVARILSRKQNPYQNLKKSGGLYEIPYGHECL